jgi:hypothetical protein
MTVMRVISLPRAAAAAAAVPPKELQGKLVARLGGAGAVPEQPHHGLALANTPGLALVRVGGKVRWGIVSQVAPDTVYVFSGSSAPSQAAAEQAAQDYMEAVGYASGQAMATETALGSVHDTPMERLAWAHEYMGLVTDLFMSLAAGTPMHHTDNTMVIRPSGAAVGMYEYRVPDDKRVLVDLRFKAVTCLLGAPTAPTPAQ